MSRLREAWTRVVRAEDYDAFMASIGQAQANARLIAAMLPAMPSRILFAGAGTGQMLEFMDCRLLAPHQLFFADINPVFLHRLRERAAAAGLNAFQVTDDLENSSIRGPFDLAVVVLVLEHIDWRRGIESLSGMQLKQCGIVIQQNPAEMATAVTPGRIPPGTMSIMVQAKPRLVPADELMEAMSAHGFELEGTRAEAVADGKQMLCLTWKRVTP